MFRLITKSNPDAPETPVEWAKSLDANGEVEGVTGNVAEALTVNDREDFSAAAGQVEEVA